MIVSLVRYTWHAAYPGKYNVMKSGEVLLTFLATLFVAASSDLQFDNGHSRTGNTGGIDEVLREPGSFSAAGEATLWEAVDQVIDFLGKDRLENILGLQPGLYSDSLSSSTSVMNLWSNLPANTKETILKRIFPFITSRSSRGGNPWTLHCAVGRDICRTDNNCNSKYEQFVSSCSSDEANIVDPVNSRFIPTQHSHQKTSKRQPKTGSKRSIKRDVEIVQSRLRNKGKIIKRHRRKNKRNSVSWMGKRLSPRSSKPTDMQRYFSLQTKTYKCSLRCVQLLHLLNYTIYGALLAHCDCRANTMPEEYKTMLYQNLDISQRLTQSRQEYLQNWESTCFAHQRIAQVCRPRIYVGTKETVGCTEVRRKCKNDQKCNNAHEQFVKECSMAISGVRCTRRCRESIKLLRNSTTQLNSFDNCICDGTEGPFCSDIRKNIKRLCDDSENSRLRTLKKKDNSRRLNFRKDGDFDKKTHQSYLNWKNALNTAASSVMLRNNILMSLIAFVATRFILRESS